MQHKKGLILNDILPITLVYTFGNMLVGFILGKIYFFHATAKTKKITTYFIVIGGTLGFLESFVFHQVTVGALELSLPLLWVSFVLAAGMIMQSLFYISLFVLPAVLGLNFFII